MKRNARFLAALLALTLLLSGCALEETPEAAPSATPTSTPEAEEDIVIATVAGEAIYLSEFAPIMNYYQEVYSMYYGVDFSDAAMLQSLQESVLDMIIQSKLILQQAEQEGFTLSEEELATAKTTAETNYDSALASYRDETAEDPDAAAMEAFTARLAEQGMTPETYRTQLEEDVRDSMLAEKLQESVFTTVSLTEAEAEARFAEDLAGEKAGYSADLAAFEAAQSSYESMGGMPPLYTPEGFRRVKHILINISEERPEAEALELAEELYERAKGGEDFDALMAEYGEDPGMQAEPNKSLGYLTYAGTSFVPEFLEGAMSLKEVGDLTEPIKTDYGYHVIKLESLVKSGEVAFADVKELYMENLLATLEEEAFAEALTSWTEATEIVTYLDRIPSDAATEPEE